MKCKVCGKRFVPKSEKRYLITKTRSIADALSGGENVFECFDCPRCGCQIVVQERCANFIPCSKIENDKEIEGE